MKNFSAFSMLQRNKLPFLAFLASIVFHVTLSAQVDEPILETEEVEVIKNFRASLEEAEKVMLDANMPEAKKKDELLDYQVPSRLLGMEYPAPKIRPLAMKRDKQPEKYAGFAKAGYGTPSSPYGELSYHFNKEEAFNFGGAFKHHSANYKQRENQAFSSTNFNLYGTNFFDQGFALTGNAAFQNDGVRLYGYNDMDTSFTKEQVARNIQTLSGGLRFFNGPATVGNLNYHAAASFYRLQESFADSKETGVNLDLGVTHYFEGKHPLNLRIINDLTSFQDTAKQSLNNFYFQPDFALHAEQFILKVGANLIANNNDFLVYPNLELAVIILGSRLTAFAGWEGGNLQKNTMRSILAYNPFASSIINLRNTNYRDIHAGVKGKMKSFEYEGQLGLKNAKNLALFLNNPADARQLDVLYDTVSIFYIKGSVIANLVNNLEAVLTLSNSIYDTKNEEKAWHLPALEANAAIKYKSSDERFACKAELYLANGVPFLNAEGVRDRLNPLYDLSFAFDYWFAQNIGAFLQLNNLANNRRERWSGYPIYGLNVLAGVTAKF